MTNSPKQLGLSKRIMQIALVASATLVGVFIALIIVGFLVARSQWASDYGLARFKEVLERDFATSFSYEAGHVDISRGIYFKNLKIHAAFPPSQADVSFGEIDLQYEIHPFSFEFSVERFWMKGIRVNAELKAKTTEEQSAEDKKKTAQEKIQPLDLDKLTAQVEKFLLAPPVRVVIHDVFIDVEDIAIRLNNTLGGGGAGAGAGGGAGGGAGAGTGAGSAAAGGEQATQVSVRNLSFKTDFALLPGQVRAHLDVIAQQGGPSGGQMSGQTIGKNGGAISISTQSKSSAVTSKLQLAVSKIDLKNSLHIWHDSGRWSYSLDKGKSDLDIGPIKFNSQGSGGNLDFALENIAFAQTHDILASTAEFGKFAADSLKEFSKKTSIKMGRLTFSSGPKMHVEIPSQTITSEARLAPGLVADFHYVCPELKAVPVLAKTIALRKDVDLTFSPDLKSVHIVSKAKLDQQALAEASIDFKKSDGSELSLAGSINFHLGQSLARALPAAQALVQMGGLEPATEFNLTMNLPTAIDFKSKTQLIIAKLGPLAQATQVSLEAQANVQMNEMKTQYLVATDVINPDIGSWRVTTKGEAAPKPVLVATGETQVEQIKVGISKVLPEVKLMGTLTLHHEVHDKAVKATLHVPEIVAKGLVQLKAGEGQINIQASEKPLDRLPDNPVAKTPAETAPVTISFEYKQGSIVPLMAAAKGAPPIEHINAELVATVKPAESWSLDRFSVKINQDLLAFTAAGSGSLKTHSAQIRTGLDVHFGSGLKLMDQTLMGEIHVPTHIAILDGREIRVEGDANLSEVGFSKGPISVTGISGHIPWSENLVVSAGKLGFRELITQNPFERVNFDGVRPLLQSADQLTIAKFGWEEKTFGPFIGFISLKQNLFSVNQFDLSLGSGKMYGEMFFDAYPANLQFGLLSRLTGLNLREFLPQKFVNKMGTSERNVLSARTALVMNLQKSSLDGRVDVTEIGGAQLIAMINILDPDYSNDKFNKLRQVLAVGYPTGVGIGFEQGFMSMDVDISTLGISQHQSLRGIPLTRFISSATEPVMKLTRASSAAPKGAKK